MANIYDKASLVLIPSGTKEGVIFSQKPTNGDGDFTFSRSTAATRVNADGLIEKETQNLLLQSNSFNTWNSISISFTSGQSGYDGNDAWLLTKSGAGGRIENNISKSGVHTFSVYAKAGTLNWIRLLVLGGGNRARFFDLQNGAIGGSSYSDEIDANIEDVGNGWYRCSITTNVSMTQVRIYPANADLDTSGTSGNIYLQDAQLEQGLVARDYIETTTAAVEGGITDNVPRLDYTDASCPSLLLEPQRTNLVINSEHYSASSWQNVGATITDNNAISPEGKQNATLLVGTSGNSARVQDYFGALSGVHTYSLFIKSTGVATRLNLQSNDVGGATFSVPTSGAPTLYGEGTNVGDPFIEDYGSGWYRVGFSFTPSGGGVNNYFQIYPDSSGNVSSIYAYGAQCEEGSYATSYIPTYGTSVTFESDGASNTNTIDADNDFTMLIESKSISPTSDLKFFDGIGYLNVNSSGNLRFRYNSTNYSNSIDYTQTFKWLLRKDSTSMKIYLNGVLTHTITSGIASGSKDIDLEGGMTTNFMVFPTALTDEEAIALTQE